MNILIKINNIFYKFSKLIIRIFALVFTILYANTIIGIFNAEMGITLYTLTLGIIIGVIANLGFFLATFQFGFIGKILISIILIPSIIFNVASIHMITSIVFIPILWGLFIGILSFIQLFKKGESII